MRLPASMIACLAATALLGSHAHAAEARGKRSKHGQTSEQGERKGYRSSTIGPNGECWRDTGRPFNSLNLNHRCDREEFWARMNDRGNDRN